MPTYVYECRTCGKVVEVEQRITEDPLTDCDCGEQGSLKRVIQPTSVMFKGGGFHINDYSAKPAPVESAPTEASTSAPTETPTSAPKSAPEQSSSAS